MSENILGQAFERFQSMENERKFESVRQAVIDLKQGADPASISREQVDAALFLVGRFNKAREQYPIESAPELLLIAGKASPAQAAL